MKLAALSIALFTVAAPALAETKEQKAVLWASHRAFYERTRHLCLAGGVPMDTYEQVVPAKAIEIQAALKDAYPQFWSLGTSRGISDANDAMKLAGGDLLPKMCAFVKSETIKRMD